MTRYRIVPFGVPFGADRWKVQERFLFFWLNATRYVGYDAYELITFPTEAEAEQWIDAALRRERDWEAQRREIARHRGHYIPREYPDSNSGGK